MTVLCPHCSSAMEPLSEEIVGDSGVQHSLYGYECPHCGHQITSTWLDLCDTEFDLEDENEDEA